MVPRKMCNRNACTAKKVMVSAVIIWKGVSQSFFIGGNGVKVNGASYLKHLRDDLIPAAEAMYPNKDSCKIKLHRIAPVKCKTSCSRS